MTPASPIRLLAQVLATPLLIQFSTDKSGKAAGGSPSTRAPGTHGGDPDEPRVPGFSLAQLWLFDNLGSE